MIAATLNSRHQRKIGDAVECAALVSELIVKHGSFDAYLRSFGSPEDEIDDLHAAFPAWVTVRPGGSCSRSGCRSRRPGDRHRGESPRVRSEEPILIF